MAAGENLDRRIAVADGLCIATKRFVDESLAALRSKGYVMRVRDEVIASLALKIDSAFRALIDDARSRRVEAVHHLKTMVEAFIYMFAVGKDDGDRTASRVIAEVYASKAEYFRLNPDRDTPSGEYRAGWQEAVEGACCGGHYPDRPRWRGRRCAQPGTPRLVQRRVPSSV
jgi:hypothetical protein